MKKALAVTAMTLLALAASAQKKKAEKVPFAWEAANLYFLMTDRFHNGDAANDVNFGRDQQTGKFRGFEGGDLKGITHKIEEGYFDRLGINAIWMTPIVEQIHGGTDEGQGLTYGFHGYWTKDWTRLDPNFGTEEDLHELIAAAHRHGIRIVLDAVINHTGPVTAQDPAWPDDWVRTGPQCEYKSYESTTACTLVRNLPDVLTESDKAVELPPFLLEKWKREGRLETELRELDAFFERTDYPRAPRYYIIKWLTDYVRKFGIDGYRADTVKHTNPGVWLEFRIQCQYAFDEWKKENPRKKLDDTPFFTVAEVFGYGISGGLEYDFGDRRVNYFNNGFGSMINFEFRWDADKDYRFLFEKYGEKLNGVLKGHTVLNYTASHDDGNPFDASRTKPFETAAKLLLSPGMSQVYYGDESARPLVVPGAEGDANLRSPMNWDDIQHNPETQKILAHWQKIGRFRRKHPAVGAGTNTTLAETPYVCGRTFTKGNYSDSVVIAPDMPAGKKTILVAGFFPDGTKIRDAYSGKTAVVANGKAVLNTPGTILLLERAD